MLLELDILDGSERDQVNNPDLGKEKPKRNFWRSFAHLEESSEYQQFVKGEFMPGAIPTEQATQNSRRKFMQLMGASMGMMGLAACRKPFDKILPYTRQPENIIPGKPLYYATAMPWGGAVRPILVESHEGRPTKIEGNPDHPYNTTGASGLYEQATILNMFDPDRTRHPKKDGKSSNWEAFKKEVIANLAGKKVAVLAPSLYSPSLAALKAALEAKGGKWYTFDGAGDDSEALGLQMAFGRALRPVYAFSKTKEQGVIVSLDADFLAPTDRNYVKNTSEFAASRKVLSPADNMSRLYVVESAFSLTGGMADNRLALRSSDVPAFTAALAAEMGIAEAAGKAGKFAGNEWVKEIAADLKKSAGKSIVLAGATQPPVVHALAALINNANGNIGQTVALYEHPQGGSLTAQTDQVAALVNDIKGGQVDALLMLGTNPVYNAPADLDFASALSSVGLSVHAGLIMDETGQKSKWHLPLAHFLEAWGDGWAMDGTRSIIQPLIAPLFGAKSDIELANMFANGTDVSGYDLVKAQNANINWDKSLNDGFIEGTTATPVAGVSGASLGAALDSIQAVGEETLEVVVRPHTNLFDGTFSNNAWMQEAPEPITKLVWDGVAIMSPATAKKKGLTLDLSKGNFYADIVEVKVNDKSVKLPLWLVPGYAENSITVNLGYGRKLATDNQTWGTDFFSKRSGAYMHGPIAHGWDNETIGDAAEKLRTTKAFHVGIHADVSKVGAGYELVTTQDHGALDWDSRGGIESQQDRRIVRLTTLEEYKKKPRYAKDYEHKVDPKEVDWSKYPSLWENDRADAESEHKDHYYAKYQWAMAIDLNACTGCGACHTACQSENNIPVVGKEQVGMGREMSWMRLDRYFYGSEEHPGMVVQPMICQHCEQAPCEQVCPINATSHSPDGINEMTYNRCVGTRYCANNCPYKVRRYNFLNWTKDLPAVVQMTQNPNVTVRFRGVMEKCTFCVQRIREAGVDARREQRDLKEGEILTACQQACPAQAITFGNLTDSNSAISKLKKHERNYEILAELANRPRVSYIARVTNPNPALKPPHYRDGAHHGGHEEHHA